MASDITVSGLVITPGLGQVFAEWIYDDPNVGGLSYYQLEAVELWAATSNDRSLATKVEEGLVSAIHLVSDGLARWYWIRARDRAGSYGAWHPSSVTGGVASAATGSLTANGWWKLPPGIIFQWGSVEVTDSANITFPVAFPNSSLKVFGTVILSGSAPFNELYSAFFDGDTLTASGVMAYARRQVAGVTSAPTLTVAWLAIGY